MNDNAKIEHAMRERILMLLSDDDVARVSTAEATARPLDGEEYIDLENLDQGVRSALGAPAPMNRLVQSVELRERLGRAVNSLSPALRSIFLPREVREMSTEDSAEVLGLSIPAAKTRLHRARKVFRMSLGSYVAC